MGENLEMEKAPYLYDPVLWYNNLTGGAEIKDFT